MSIELIRLRLLDDKDDKESLKALHELENIDDELDAHGIVFVKIDDDNEAKEYGFDELPVIVYFENKVPSLYEGDLDNEEEVLKWLIHQKTADTIEEVTEEMLQKLIGTHQYVAVYFSGPCNEDEGENDPSDCDEILDVSWFFFGVNALTLKIIRVIGVNSRV